MSLEPSAINFDNETIQSNAYDLVMPELLALDPGALEVVNLEVGAAVNKVLGALPEIRAIRQDILTHLPTFRLSLLDDLEQYAFALSWANSLFVTAVKDKDALPGVAAEAATCRESLRTDAMFLCKYKLLNPEAFRAYKGTAGYATIADDLLLLTSVLLRNWPSIDGKIPLQQEEVIHADKLGMHLRRMIGLRAQSPVVVAAAADNRKRAFTLLVQAYDAVRKAMTYLRWETGDIESIAPSLYAKAKRKTKKDHPAPAPEPDPQEPTVESLAPNPVASSTAPAPATAATAMTATAMTASAMTASAPTASAMTASAPTASAPTATAMTASAMTASAPTATAMASSAGARRPRSMPMPADIA